MAIEFSKTSEYLSSLISAGNDAMTNLYYLKFIGGNNRLDDDDYKSMLVRAGDFQAPKAELGNHKVDFLTVDSLMPSPEIKMNKQFDVTFRVDEYFEIYKLLLKLQSQTSVASLGRAYTTVNQNTSTDYFGLNVYVPGDATKTMEIDDKGIPYGWNKIYEFDYLWIKKITPPRFSYDNSSALTVTVTFGFFTFKDNFRENIATSQES